MQQNIKSTAIPRAGYEYQDLVGIQILIDFYRNPQKYQWIELESQDKQYGSLDDIVALRVDMAFECTQVKFTVDPDRYYLNWDWLLEKTPNGTSLLEKWGSSLKVYSSQGKIFFAKLRTNRQPDEPFKQALRNDNIIELGSIPDKWKEAVIAQLGGQKDAETFFQAFKFEHSEKCIDNLEVYLQGQLIPFDTDIKGWLLLRSQVTRWAIRKNVPEPDGRILHHHLVQIITKSRSQPISQDFRVPKTYSVPNQEFHESFLTRLTTDKAPLTILWGTPGRGKSTYLSFLIKFLESQKYSLIRHHYFLSLDDTHSNRIGFTEISESLQYQMSATCPEAVRGLSEKPTDLRAWLEACGQYYKKENKNFLVFIDGLDHVWRDQQDISQLNHLCNYILPCPENVSIIFGTQRVSNKQLPHKLLCSIDEVDWVEIPRMDKDAVANWVENQNTGGQIIWPEYINENESRKSEELGNLSKAFFDISCGHPLHLIYSFESLVRRGVKFSAEEVNSLPSCPDGNIQTYYKGLWVRFSAQAKQILHIVAATDFRWPENGIKYCTGCNIEEIDYLFEHKRTGLMPFHGSILAYVREQPNHQAVYAAALPVIIKWLENEASEFLKWGWLWVLKAKNGDATDLLNKTTRSWAIESLVKGWPINRLTEVLLASEIEAFRRGDYNRTIELRSLKTRLLNGSEFQTNQFSAFWEAALKATNNQDEIKNLADDLLILTEDEIRMLAEAANRSNSEITGECFDRLGRNLNIWIKLRNRPADEFTRLVECFLDVLALRDDADLTNSLEFIEQLENKEGYLRKLIDNLTRAGNLSELISMLAYFPLAREPHRREYLLNNIVRWACLEEVDLSKRLSPDVLLSSPLLSCWQLLKGYSPESIKYNFITATVIKESYEYGQNFALEQFFHSIFFSSLTIALIAEGNYSFVLPGVPAPSGRLISILEALNNAARRLVEEKLVLSFDYIYDALGTIEPIADYSPSEPDPVQYRSLKNALYQIASDLHCLQCLKTKAKPIEFSAFQAARSSCHWSNEAWLHFYLQRELPQLEDKVTSVFLNDLIQGNASRVTTFNERIESYIDIARFAVLYKHPKSSEILQRAANCIIGYGWRKDAGIFDILDSIKSIHNSTKTDVLPWLKTLSPIIDEITEFTDGDETRHAKTEFIEILSETYPEYLPECYSHHISQDEFYLAEKVLDSFSSHINFKSSLGNALAQTFLGESEVLILEKLSASNPDAKRLYEKQVQYLGGLGGLIADRERQRETSKDDFATKGIAPDISKFEPSQFGELINSMSDYSFGYKLKENTLTEWAKYWKDKGKGIEILQAIESYFDTSESTYNAETLLDDAFLISLEVEGKKAAYKWLVKAHIYRNGWASYWTSEDETMRRLKHAATYYGDKWREYISDTSKPAPFYEKRKYSFIIGIKYLVRFLLLVGQTELAVSFTDTCIKILIDEMADQPIPKSRWLN